jgi:uncharacterized protein involved in exopolysaccharide biosynthesis
MTAHMSNGHENGSDMFDVAGAVRSVGTAVVRYRWLTLAVWVMVIAAVGWYIYAWPPVYRTEALIMLEREEDLARDEFYVNWNIFRKEDARTEIELMRSGPILKEVIEREKLTYDDVYHPIGSQLRYFWEKSWPGRQYRGVKEYFFPPKDTFAGLSPEEKELGKTISDLAASIMIMPVGESHVGKLVVKGPSPRVAKVANTLMDIYAARRMERYETEATKALTALSAEKAKAQEDLKGVEERRVAFYRDNSVSLNFQQELTQVEQLNKLEMEISTRRALVAQSEAALEKIESQLALEQATKMISSVQELNTVREAAKLRRLEYEMSLIHARDRYDEDSPEVREIKADLAKLDEILAAESERVETSRTEGANTIREKLLGDRVALQAELAATRAGLTEMETTAAGIRTRLACLPALQTELLRIDRDQGVLQERYQVLALKHAQAEVSLATSNAAMPSLRIAAYAVAPGSRSWPRLSMLAPAAFFGGLFIAVAVAVFRLQITERVHPETLRRRCPDLPVYVTMGRRNLTTSVGGQGSGSHVSSDDKVVLS